MQALSYKQLPYLNRSRNSVVYPRVEIRVSVNSFVLTKLWIEREFDCTQSKTRPRQVTLHKTTPI